MLIITVIGGDFMENMKFNDYNIAEISKNNVTDILELEKTLSQNANKEIVLIAYQHTSNDK